MVINFTMQAGSGQDTTLVEVGRALMKQNSPLLIMDIDFISSYLQPMLKEEES